MNTTRPALRALPVIFVLAAGCGGEQRPPFDAAGFVDAADVPDGANAPDAAGPRAWARGAVLYRVDVRSFQDTDGDGAGDFAGLASRLDYVSALGATALVLLPVTPSDDPASGGFAPLDLFSTDPAYGTVADFSALAAAAHARSLRVIVDLPLDAASSAHPFFRSAADPASGAHHDDFVFAPAPCPMALAPDGAPAWQPLDARAECYWAKAGPARPEWNYASASVLGMAGDAVEFWLDRGADGVEFDGAGWWDDSVTSGAARADSAGSHASVAELSRRAHARREDAVVMAQPALDTLPAMAALAADGVDVVRTGAAFEDALYLALAGGGSDALGSYLAAAATVPATVAFSAGDERSPPGGRSADVVMYDRDALALAALVLLAAPGDPMVFYGDELGLGAGAPDAAGARSRLDPMAWDSTDGRGFTTGTPWTAFSPDLSTNVADERGAGGSTLETYRTLLAARRRSPALSRGTFTRIATQSAQVLAFLREADGERALVVVNFDTVERLPAMDLAAAGITTARVTDLRWTYVEPPVTAGNAGAYGRLLPARSGRWLRVE